jgi:hypothetical protein
MNRRLGISLLGNLLLAMLVLWLVRRPPDAVDHPPVPVAAGITNAPLAAPAAQSEPARTAPEPKPFRWSQLDPGNDYREYVANLRAIGCPEKIIRAIVQMDADGAFASKRAQLRLDGSGTGPWSQYREMELVATLLGEPPAAAETAAAPPTEQNPRPRQARQPAPSFPLVLQPVDENALQLTDAQKQVLGQLRQQFIDEIGGTNQDPNDPAYLARWQKAQRGIDDTLRGLLGLKFYLNYRSQAANAVSSR